MRRTSSIDLTRPLGAHGPLSITGRARDLRTDATGSAQVADAALLHVTVEGGVSTSVSMYPTPERASALVGHKVGAGWRTRVARQLRDHHDAGSVLHLLLDELPVGMIISGFTQRHLAPATTAQHTRRLDVCAGWIRDGSAARAVRERGIPPEPPGPLAAPLPDPADPVGWHTLAPLPTWGISRLRRIDVWPRGDCLAVDAMFRDTYVDGAGRSRVLHEYAATATIDTLTDRVLAIEPTARVVPHEECPAAVGSAQGILGVAAGDLRDRVSMDLFGPRSCTHLNDLLRSLADVPALAAVL